MSQTRELLISILEDLKDLNQMNEEILETYKISVNEQYNIMRKLWE
jgi:flagellar biosynthesis/type III secretory pathway chaperone